MIHYATPWYIEEDIAYRIAFPENDIICMIVKTTKEIWRANTFFSKLHISMRDGTFAWSKLWYPDFSDKEEAMRLFDDGWKKLGYKTISKERAEKMMLLV
jgi:hypothetical protein